MPIAGRRYLTPTRLPVEVLEVHAGDVVVQSLASDNRFSVPASYPLQLFNGEGSAFELRPTPYRPFVRPLRGRSEPKCLAPIIDALLLEGGLTMRGLVREVRRRASAACRGKDVRANIRARMYWLRKKGMSD